MEKNNKEKIEAFIEQFIDRISEGDTRIHTTRMYERASASISTLYLFDIIDEQKFEEALDRIDRAYDKQSIRLLRKEGITICT